MRRKTTTLTAVAVLMTAMLGLAAGCKKKPPTTVPDERPPSEAPSTPETQVPPPPGPPTGTDVRADDLSGDLDALNRRGLLGDALFDYDAADLRDDARTALATNAEFMKRNASVQVLIEGHCDERGTSEYNLALGDRRANAARDYVVSLGVDGSRVRTVSYGKERPGCDAATEECYQQNRRAHFVITAK